MRLRVKALSRAATVVFGLSLVQHVAAEPKASPQPTSDAELGFGASSAERQARLAKARSVLERLAAKTSDVEGAADDGVVLARSRSAVASATAVSAWLDWLPDLSLALRRQVRHDLSENVARPSWRIDMQAQATLSLQKLRAALAAGAAHDKAEAEVAVATHGQLVTRLINYLALYLAERRSFIIRQHADELRALLAGVEGGELASDATLLRARLAEVLGQLTQGEGTRRRALADVRSTLRQQIERTDLDPRLAPAELLLLIDDLPGLRGPLLEVELADLQMQRQGLRLARSQRWYVPELRLGALAVFPRVGNPDGAYQLNRLTAELALALELTTVGASLENAQLAAIDRSQWLLLQAKLGWQQQAELAAVTRAARMAVLSDDSTPRAANEALVDLTQRYARGELGLSSVTDASSSYIDARLTNESLLEEAVAAQVLLSSVRMGGSGGSSDQAERLTAADATARSERAIPTQPSLQAALAGAAQARQLAISHESSVKNSVEAGILTPLYERDAGVLRFRPELGLAGAALAPIAVEELSLLGRWTIAQTGNQAQLSAARAEASLSDVRVEYERKRLLASHARARQAHAFAAQARQNAEQSASLARQIWASQAQWQRQGVVQAPAVRRAQVRLDAALARLERAKGKVHAAELSVGAGLSSGPGTRVSVVETPALLASWLRDEYYPKHRLFGYDAGLRRKLAELEALSARARARASVPSRGAQLTTQATQGLRGGSYSLTVGVGVALDPSSNPREILRAAAEVGATAGRLAVLSSELERERLRELDTLSETERLLAIERSARARLLDMTEQRTLEQAAAPDVHPSVKELELGFLQAELFDSEARQTEVEERRAAAELRLLELGQSTAGVAPAAVTQPATMTAIVSKTVETAASVRTAAATMQAVRARRLRPPIVGGLRLAGPFAAASYAESRAPGPTTSTIGQGTFGVGAALHLDESASFVASARQREAETLAHSAEKRRAELETVERLAELWTARELERLALREEALLGRKLQASILPRFQLGQVTSHQVSKARAEYASAQARLAVAGSEAHALRSSFARGGAAVSDAALDELDRSFAASTRTQQAHPSSASASEPRLSSVLLEARARSSAATAHAVTSALRVVSPIVGLLELTPAAVKTETAAPAAQVSTSEAEISWAFSLLVPLKLKAVGASVTEAERASLYGAQAAVVARRGRKLVSELELSQAAGLENYAAALDLKASAERAYQEMDRRYRGAEAHTALEDVTRLEQAVFAAERACIEARGALLETDAKLRSLLRGPP